jgi:hypothetical protein
MGRWIVLIAGAAAAIALAVAVAGWLRPDFGSPSLAASSNVPASAPVDPARVEAPRPGRMPTYVVGTDNLRHDLDDLAPDPSSTHASAPAPAAAGPATPEVEPGQPEPEAVE